MIEIENITKTYTVGTIDTPVLRGVSLKVEPGEFLALMGPSGSGKTTLMNILGCLDRPTSGSYTLGASDVTRMNPDERAALRNQSLGFVFQNFNLLPRTTALDNVMMPLSYGAGAVPAEEGKRRATDLLRRMGLGDRMHHETTQLSGGQQQRVAIARALINRPAVLLADEPTGNLDSKTSAEMLEIIRVLNEEDGVTIILVTHDENVGRAARRVIRLKDGVIESDTTEKRKLKARHFSTGQASVPALRALPRIGDLIRQSLIALRRNLMRAALTALGIIIGVAAVIAMMEIGRGSASAIQNTISSMGANNLLIVPGTASTGGVSFGAGSVMTLTPEDAAAVGEQASAVRASAPVVRARSQVVYGNRNWVPTYIYGTTPSFLEVREWPTADGEMFQDRDVRNASKVCVIGQTVVRELFGSESALGKEVRLNNVPFRIVGILSRKGANMMGLDQDDVLIAPWTAVKFRVSGSSLANTNQSAASTTDQVNTLDRVYPGGGSLYPVPSTSQAANSPLPVRFINVDQILAAAKSPEDVPTAVRQISEVLRTRHRIGPGDPDDFTVRDMAEMTKALASTTTMMTNLLLVVALISLIVGGVGIMNIMLVSVTERTREIGLRMAVGAGARRILQQFLTEAVILCFFGGAVGILLGRTASLLIRVTLQWPTELSIGAILSAFLVSATVGIVFGWYPAWKASQLDPITALRYE